MNVNMNICFHFHLVRSNNQSEWIFVTYSSVETFELLFPSGDHQLIVSIRDKRDCVTQVNLTSISVRTDLLNSLNLLLSHGNSATKTQVMNIISQEMNQNNLAFIQNASSSYYRTDDSICFFIE